jgi:hypothetical protein
MKKYVIAYCSLGLCNRLKCLITALRYAHNYSLNLLLCWEKDFYVNCNISDLFQNKFEEISLNKLNNIIEDKANKNKYIIISTWRLLVFPEDDLPHNFSKTDYSKTGRIIDCEYNRIPLTIQNEYLKYLNILIPKKEIINKVDEYAANITERTVSVSIRSWNECNDRQSLFSMRNLIKYLDCEKDIKYFVSSDSADIIKKLIEIYSERILYYPKSTYTNDRISIKGMQDILIDLLLLGKSKKIYVSYLSTFSEMAWWFGQCQAKVSLIPAKTYLFKMIYREESDIMWSIFYKWYNSIPILSKVINYLYKFYLSLKKIFLKIKTVDDLGRGIIEL